jgi:hypothetical protein
MKLNVLERTQILQILPTEGDFTILRVLQDIQRSVGFSDEEHKEFNIRRSADKVSWGPEEGKSEAENEKYAEAIAKEKEIELGVKATEIIKDALLDLDKKKKLTPVQFTLYEKFVQDKGQNEEEKDQDKKE